MAKGNNKNWNGNTGTNSRGGSSKNDHRQSPDRGGEPHSRNGGKSSKGEAGRRGGNRWVFLLS